MLIFYFFAAIQIFIGYKSFRSGIDFLRFFKGEIAKPESGFEPFASVIVPCRGIDRELERNLAAVCSQKYSDFEIVFVVDSADDEAVAVIEKILSGERGRRRLIVAGKASASGQKVHNLRAAVKEISDKSELLVFVDSDARPANTWLRNLAAPLKDNEIGCSTGYRWFIQETGGFPTQLRAVWNASIASALGPDRSGNFCWGGSTGIRREVFEKLGIRDDWKGVVSDDFVLTAAVRRAGLSIYFVPQCLTATLGDCSFTELLEFTTRQMKLTRVYAEKLWIVSFISAFLFVAVFWGGLGLLLITGGIHFWMTLSLLLIILVLGTGKAWLRLTAVRLVLTSYEKELDRQGLWQSALWLISPLLFLYNDIAALCSRKIVWRGIKYELESSSKTNLVETDG